MFFGLRLINTHPCSKMQEVVDSFFTESIEESVFSLQLFPSWFRHTLTNSTSVVRTKFFFVHALLHSEGMDVAIRRRIADQVQLTNKVEDLCGGVVHLGNSFIDWNSELGKAVSELMLTLYQALDLSVFKKANGTSMPTHQFYSEFINENKYVCPFCGLTRYRNRLGPRREDFDHYLSKALYPLAAANMINLIPTCSICNQDYKRSKDILADGAAFYPYADDPPVVKVDVDCIAYPAKTDTRDHGAWLVKLTIVSTVSSADLRMKTWERVYSIKKRLENEIGELFEEWMTEVSEGHSKPLNEIEFITMIENAIIKAKANAARRVQPGQIIKEAFYNFMLSRASKTFLESFRRLQNNRCT